MPTSLHEHPEEWLAAALTDGLAPDEERVLAEHLAACPDCRALRDDFAQLDEMLLRDFPEAVGPVPAFETRLVSAFRTRYQRGSLLARLRGLLGWLVRLRSAQIAGGTAVLLALVAVGSQLSRTRYSMARNSFDDQITGARVNAASSAPQQGFADRPDALLGNIPPGDVDVGRDVTARRNELQIPIPQEARSIGGHIAARPFGVDSSSLTITGNNADFQYPRSANDSSFSAKGLKDKTDLAEPAAPRSPATTVPASADALKLIRNAHAELEVENFDACIDAITASAVRAGGFLDTRNSARGANGKLTGTLVVKVLPESLDAFLTGLRALGELKNQTIQSEDVTKDYFDTDARLRNSRRMEERLLKMVDEVKGKMSEVLQVEKELARVRAEIEEMQGQLKLYDAEVRFATVTLSIYEKDLHQPAAFLLRETGTLALLVPKVEDTAAEVRRLADADHVQVVRSETTRDGNGEAHATLRLLIAPETSDALIAKLRTLGRVGNYQLDDERVAQNGASESAAANDLAKVERAPVTLDISIGHDEQISRQVSFTLVTPDAETAFEKARTAAVAAGAEIVASNVARAADGHATATLGVRVPSAAEAGLVGAFQALGRAGEIQTRRISANPDPVADAGPVLVQLSVVELEPAVQQTSVRIETSDVENRANDIKNAAAAAHAEVIGSEFSSESNGSQQAELKFRLPMTNYAAFVARVRALGAVKDFTVQRQDRPAKNGGAADAPAEITLTLFHAPNVVGESSGLGATLRRTFGDGAGALMWSVQMIGVAVAFLAPWVALVVLVGGTWWWLRRRRRSL